MIAGSPQEEMPHNNLCFPFADQQKRRKGTVPLKRNSTFLIAENLDNSEPINLTQRPFGGSNLRNELADTLAHSMRIASDESQATCPNGAAQPFLTDFPMPLRGLPFPLPFLPLEQEIRSGQAINSIFNISSPGRGSDRSNAPTDANGKTMSPYRDNVKVLQLINSCLEQIPLPPAGSEFQDTLTNLYSQTVDQARCFQKSVLRYLTELYIKNQINFNEDSSRPSADVLAQAPPEVRKSVIPRESDGAIDLRVQPRDQASLFRAHSAQDALDFTDCCQSPSLSESSISQRAPLLSAFSNPFCSAFTPTMPSSRLSLRHQPSFLSGRRPKASAFKSKKPRSIGSHTPPTQLLDRDNHLLHSKKTNFRGTSEEENEVCPNFRPTEKNVSKTYPFCYLVRNCECSLVIPSSKNTCTQLPNLASTCLIFRRLFS